MIVKLLTEPNVVYEAAMLLYDAANNVSFREKKGEFERSSVEGSDELMTGLDTFAKFTELIGDKNDVPDELLTQLFLHRPELDSCLAFYILHDVFASPEPNFITDLEKINNMSKATFFANIYYLLLGRFPELADKVSITSYADIIKFISVLPVSGELKWELTSFYNDFDAIKGQLAVIIGKVGKLFFDGYELVSHYTDWFLANYRMSSASDPERYLRENYKVLDGKNPDILYVLPCASAADRIAYKMNYTEEKVTDFLYIGVLHSAVVEASDSPFDDTRLTKTLKVMGDKSKFEIMRILSKEPKFGLELAQALEISTATISHHMSQLEEMDLIRCERDSNRVYYSLNRETVEYVVRNLNKLFLED
jgi:DNA-binding transcriptional ArsR family regulator